MLDTTDPDIQFGIDGVCNYCNQYVLDEKKRLLAKTDYPWVIHRIKKEGQGKPYDCLIGLSGGVDSSLCLHYLKEAGVRPLAFTIDNGWNTEAADLNIMNLVETLKVPFYRYTIDIEKFKILQKAFIESQTPNIEIPTDHILMAASYDVADKYRLKTIISGGNLATESIMPPSWGYNAKDLWFIKAVYRASTGTSRMEGFPTISLMKFLKRRFVDGIKIVNLLDYHEYNREGAKKLLKEKYRWQDYGEKHEESKFTKWFQNEYLIKLGIDKRKAHYSSLINSRQMTRDEALKKLGDTPRELKLIKTHHDYPNSEKIWERLSRIYSKIK